MVSMKLFDSERRVIEAAERLAAALGNDPNTRFGSFCRTPTSSPMRMRMRMCVESFGSTTAELVSVLMIRHPAYQIARAVAAPGF
jgi:hypothetical protein